MMKCNKYISSELINNNPSFTFTSIVTCDICDICLIFRSFINLKIINTEADEQNCLCYY